MIYQSTLFLEPDFNGENRECGEVANSPPLSGKVGRAKMSDEPIMIAIKFFCG